MHRFDDIGYVVTGVVRFLGLAGCAVVRGDDNDETIITCN